MQTNSHWLISGAYEPPKAVKEHEACTTCQVPSQSTKYFPYKESEILLFEAAYGMRMTTKQQWQRIVVIWIVMELSFMLLHHLWQLISSC